MKEYEDAKERMYKTLCVFAIILIILAIILTMIKSRGEFLKKHINVDSLSIPQAAGIKIAMYEYAVHYHEQKSQIEENRRILFEVNCKHNWEIVKVDERGFAIVYVCKTCDKIVRA